MVSVVESIGNEDPVVRLENIKREAVLLAQIDIISIRQQMDLQDRFLQVVNGEIQVPALDHEIIDFSLLDVILEIFDDLMGAERFVVVLREIKVPANFDLVLFYFDLLVVL